MGERLSSGSATGHTFTKNVATDLIGSDRTFLTKLASSSTTVGRFNLDNLDVSDVDSLFAFFSAQMTEAKGNVATMMRDQETRNQKTRDLQAISAKFTQYEQTGVPSDPAKRAEFLAAGDELLAALPDSKERDTIKAVLDPIKAGTDHNWGEFRAADDAADQPMAKEMANGLKANLQDKGAWVEESKDANGKAVYTVHTLDAPPVSADQVKSITASIKSVTDGLQTDSSMAMIRIQTGVEHMTQITNLCTNVLKKHDDAQDSVISNLR